MAWVYTLLLLTALSGCGKGQTEDQARLARLMPEYVTAAESMVSLIVSELGALVGPPTPGAIVKRRCLELTCTANEVSAVQLKRALGCATNFGTINGTVYAEVLRAPELTGCATSQGPPVYGSWPPTSGALRITFGQHGFSAMSSDRPPPHVLERHEDAGRQSQNWGSASLHFNGSSEIPASVDFRTRVSGSSLRLQSQAGLHLHVEQYAERAPKTIHGSLTLDDETSGIRGTVELNDLVYRRYDCCHPLSGQLSVTANLPEGAATHHLRFSSVCREAELIDSLGRATRLLLPECPI